MPSKSIDPWRSIPAQPSLGISHLGALATQPCPSGQVSRLPVLLSRPKSSTALTRSFIPDYTSLGEHLGHGSGFHHETLSQLVDSLAESSLAEGKYFEQCDILGLNGGDVVIQRLKEWDSELGYIVRSTCEWRYIESTERDGLHSWDWQAHWAQQEAEGSYYNVRDYAFVKIEEGMEYAVMVCPFKIPCRLKCRIATLGSHVYHNMVTSGLQSHSHFHTVCSDYAGPFRAQATSRGVSHLLGPNRISSSNTGTACPMGDVCDLSKRALRGEARSLADYSAHQGRS